MAGLPLCRGGVTGSKASPKGRGNKCSFRSSLNVEICFQIWLVCGWAGGGAAVWVGSGVGRAP
jgi:hypothetical protein